MLDGVQGTRRKKQATSCNKRSVRQYGFNPAKELARKAAWAKVKGQSHPACNMGGAAMKTKGYAKGGAAMKTKGAAKGGVRKPSSSKSGLYGRR